MKKLTKITIMTLILSILLVGCGNNKEKVNENGKLNIVVTTTIIGDAVRAIGRDNVNLEVLMGPGIDPHLYKASAGDMNKMKNADLIIYNL